MKELTIEQKAQRYDEALEKAKRLYEKGTITESLSYVFPELKEGDGERIRGAILHFISHTPTVPKGYISKKDMIAWLEKQSGNNIKWNKNTKDNKPQVNHSVLMQTINGIAEGEWQGEQWHQYRWAGIVRDSDVLSWIELSDIEKQSKESKVEEAMREVEEKAEAFTAAHQGENADVILAEMRGEIKPKFHEGEWIISNNKEYIYQVVEVKRGIYVIRDNADNHEYYIGIESADRDGRLWTIQDAEPGDILVCPLPKGYEAREQIFIFKGINSRDYVENCIEYYCRVYEGEFYENKTGYMGTTSSLIYPATKEQRNLLFQKVKEAGYEWDEKKKELKKLTQQEVTKISDQVEDSAWSEEDEHRAKDTIYFLDTAKKHYASTVELDACIDWLKSLKDRVGCEANCTTTKEWGEEDEKMLNDAIGAVGAADYYTYDDKQEIENWLKDIKQRIGG